MHADGTAAFSCSYCASRFSRQEHLQRHQQRHTGLRPFECNECHKSFPRRDTLRRHLAMHGQSAIQSYNESVARSKGRQAACTSCAKAKQACDGQQPCGRCQKRQATCAYGPNHRHSQQDLSASSTSTESMACRSVTVHPSVDDVPVSLSTPQRHQTAPNMDDVVSYPIAESEQAFLDPSILPGSSEFVGFAPIDSEPQNPRSDQDGVDDVDTSVTSEPLPGMALDSLALVDLPSLSFYAFDFTSSLPYPSTIMPRNHPRSALSSPAQVSPEATQFEEGCQSESTGGPPFQQIHDHVVPPKPSAFPDVQSDQLQASFSGIYCHIPHTNLLQQAHQKASEFFYSIHDHQELTGALVPTFLPFSAFNAFIQLYFEHFHPSWPFIHPSALAQPDTSWILHIGIAAVGARYATAETMELYLSAMLVLHRDAILQNRPKSPKEGELTFSQSVLLHHISLAFGGSQPQLTNMCFERSILTTLCYNRITTMTWLPDDAQPASADGLRWETWVATQSNYWLIYSAWLFECLSQIFFGMRPLMNIEDIDVPLPEQGSAWSAVTRLDWESALGKRPGGQASKKSLKKVLYDADSMQEIVPEADGFLRLLFTATLFVEENMELLRTKSWLAEGISNPSSLARSRTPTQSSLERDTPFRLQNRLKAMDADFNLLQPNFTVHPFASDLSIMEACMYHEVHIIRHVRLEVLYALTGWQASKTYVDIAERDFKLWLHDHQPTVRTCLWHAATLFGTLHSRRHMTLWEPLCFLTGAIYIWAYLKHADSKTIQPSSSENMIENQKALRLDRLTKEDERNAWIEHGFNGNVHVTGIGNLNPGEHPNRVLEELHRCLVPQTGTANLAGGIAKAAMQVCRGLSPSF